MRDIRTNTETMCAEYELDCNQLNQNRAVNVGNLSEPAVAGERQVILAEGPFFTGSTLKLRANRGFSSDYDLIRAIAGPHDVSEASKLKTCSQIQGLLRLGELHAVPTVPDAVLVTHQVVHVRRPPG